MDRIGREIVCLVEEDNTIILTEIRSHLLARFEKNIYASTISSYINKQMLLVKKENRSYRQKRTEQTNETEV